MRALASKISILFNECNKFDMIRLRIQYLLYHITRKNPQKRQKQLYFSMFLLYIKRRRHCSDAVNLNRKNDVMTSFEMYARPCIHMKSYCTLKSARVCDKFLLYTKCKPISGASIKSPLIWVYTFCIWYQNKSLELNSKP